MNKKNVSTDDEFSSQKFSIVGTMSPSNSDFYIRKKTYLRNMPLNNQNMRKKSIRTVNTSGGSWLMSSIS